MRPDKGPGNTRASGFTLIELLVVVLIIGITVGLVVISINPDEEDDIKVEARRLQELIRLASQEAIMQSNEYALEISDHGYRFLILAEQKWLPVDDTMLRERNLPGALYLEVFFDGERFDFMKTEEADEEEEEDNPRIYLFSSGEMTPVDIVLQAEGTETRYHVVTEINGKVSLKADAEQP